MKRILRVCFLILFMHFDRMAVSISRRGNKSNAPKDFDTKIKSSTLLVRRTQIKRLRSLRSDVDKFVATYVPRENLITTLSKYDQRRKRGTYRPRSVSLLTKSTTKIVYKSKKTTPSRIERRKNQYLRLIDIFSDFNDEKKKFFANISEAPKRADNCYLEAVSSFMSHCLYDHYYLHTGMKYVKNLLARACKAEWLNTKKIVRILENCCKKRFKYLPYELDKPKR